MANILLVEDDRSIVSGLTEFLTREGFSVRSAPGQAGALELLAQETFDLALLDISLADGNGFAVCSAIKAQSRLPVIFLTASGDEFSTVTGFDVGADDYIAKPFRPRELISRIKNILRLTGGGGAVIPLGDVLVDTVKGSATKAGRELYLSALEYRLLLEAMAAAGVTARVILRATPQGAEGERLDLLAASQLGGLFVDRLGYGIWLSVGDGERGARLSRDILQSAGARRYKTEFISCPGCGRTLYDLQGAVAKVKEAFGHLNRLKIAVMGCVVNGPGEMGDADYGYVGAGSGKVNLYRGRLLERAGVPEAEAVDALGQLIKEHGDWEDNY